MCWLALLFCWCYSSTGDLLVLSFSCSSPSCAVVHTVVCVIAWAGSQVKIVYWSIASWIRSIIRRRVGGRHLLHSQLLLRSLLLCSAARLINPLRVMTLPFNQLTSDYEDSPSPWQWTTMDGKTSLADWLINHHRCIKRIVSSCLQAVVNVV